MDQREARREARGLAAEWVNLYRRSDLAWRDVYTADELTLIDAALDDVEAWVNVAQLSRFHRQARDRQAQELSPRIAAVVHALLETLTQLGGGPVTAAQVMTYDHDALTVQATGGALAAAARQNLAQQLGPGLWTATDRAWEMRRPLEERVCI